MIIRTPVIFAPRVDSGTRFVTIENRVSNSTSGRTTITGGVGWFTRTMHIIGGGSVKDIFAILDGWSKGAGAVETVLANAFNITKMTFEIVGEPTCPITFGGGRSFTVQPGVANAESDYVSAASVKAALSLLPIGTEIWVKTLGTMGGVGATFVLPTTVRVASDVTGTQFGWYNPANTTIVNDPDVAGVFTWTGAAPELLTNGWAPMIGGHYQDGTNPVVMIFDGDSHTQGLQDAVASKYGRGTPQYVLKGDGSNSPVTGLRSGCNLGISGDSSSTRLSSFRMQSKAKYCTDVYTHIGSNDLGTGGGGNVNTIHSNRMNMLGLLKNNVVSGWNRSPSSMAIEYQPLSMTTNPTKILNSAPNTNWGIGEKSWQLTQLGLAEPNLTYFVMTPSFRQSTNNTAVEYFLWKYNPAATVNVYDTLMAPDGQHASNAGCLLWAADITPAYRSIGASSPDINLSMPLLSAQPTIFPPIVSNGDINILAPLLTRTASIFAPSITTDILISPPLLNSQAVIYPPVVSNGSISILMPLLSRPATIFSPTISNADISLLMPLLLRLPIIFSPTIINGDLPLFSPAKSRTLTVSPSSRIRGEIYRDDFGRLAARKDPQSTIDYSFDWSGWLSDAEDTLLSAEFFVAGGVSITMNSSANGKATAFISGGADGEEASVTCRASSSAGRVDERTLILNIVQR